MLIPRVGHSGLQTTFQLNDFILNSMVFLSQNKYLLKYGLIDQR